MESESKIVKFLSSLLNNIEDISTILLISALLIIEEYSPDFITPEHHIYLLFAVLVIICIGNIRNKYKYLNPDHKLLNLLKLKLENKVFDPITASNFFHNTPLYDEPFPTNGEILISGITLVETIGKFHKRLEDSIKNGVKVRIILLDEEIDSNIDQLISRSWGRVDNLYYKRRIKCTYTLIEVIADKIKGSGNFKGSLEVGKSPFVPPFGIIAFVPIEVSERWSNIELYHYLTGDDQQNFTVKYLNEKKRFDFYINQFEELWKISKPVKILSSN